MTRYANLFKHFTLIAAAMVMVGCLGETKTSDRDIQNIRYEQLREHLAKGDTLLIDVRRPEMYKAGHIPGAVNVPLPTMRSNDPRLANYRRLVVHAGGWTDPLSVAGAKRLIALGYKEVYEFKGGTDVWADSGGRLITAPDTSGRAETDR